ncbi:hypothethical protein (plasmid) [Ralstonia solanacearum CMR15]|nr:hypothethical protein [Ralstonia solanacearum CMR15]
MGPALISLKRISELEHYSILRSVRFNLNATREMHSSPEDLCRLHFPRLEPP